MKTKIRTNKGTQVIELEVGPPNWVGRFHKEYQDQKMNSLASATIMSTKRGTSAITASVYPKSQRTFPSKGLRISSARGTSIRTL